MTTDSTSFNMRRQPAQPAVPAWPRRHHGQLRRKLTWGCLLVICGGTLTWLPFLLHGRRARRRTWLAWAGAYLLTGASAIVLLPAAPSAAGLALLALLTGGTAHALAGPLGSGPQGFVPPELERAEARVRMVALARELVASDPHRARRLGVGRPDLDWAFNGGLVDVNHAPSSVLTEIGGLDDAVSDRVVAVRGEIGTFSCLAELDLLVDLPHAQLRSLSEVAVFLPST